MRTQNPLKVAVLGAGYFAQLHHQAWQRCKNAELVGIADPKTDVKTPPNIPHFSSLDEILEHTEIDILDIACPPHTHFDLLKAGLLGGVKKIICQKPFCGNIAQAKQAVSLAKSHHAVLIIHENFRFQPWYRFLKQAFAGRRFGEVYQFYFSLRPGDGRGEDAYLSRQPYFQKMPRFLVHETAVHFLDVFCFLFGKPSALYADLRKLNPVIAGEDAGHIILSFGDKIRAIFDGNRLSDHPTSQPRLTMGEARCDTQAGIISLSGDGSLSLRHHQTNSVEILHPPFLHTEGSEIFGGDCVYHLCQHAVDAFQAGTQPENSADEYLNILAYVDLCYKSAETGRRISLQDR